MQEKVTPLKKLRQEMPSISQERMAHQAGIVLQTYRKAEKGCEIFLSTSIAIWKALNAERRVRGLQSVSFEELWLPEDSACETKISGSQVVSLPCSR